MKMKCSTVALTFMLGGALPSTTGALSSHNLRGGMRSLHSIALGSTDHKNRAPTTGNLGVRLLEQQFLDVKLFPSDPNEYELFGSSVAISGDTVVVGSPHYTDDFLGSYNGGCAYVFERSGGIWTQQAKLLPEDGSSFEDKFGTSVSISGDTIVVGVNLDDDKGTDDGSVYVFERSGGVWKQQARLFVFDGKSYDYFGSSVSISGDTVVVGAYGDDDKGDTSGSAYVFERSDGTWTQQAKLVADNGKGFDYFGKSVSISDDTVVVGSPGDMVKDDDIGSAYVFERKGGIWTQQAKLVADGGAPGDYFGFSVSISNDTVVVGSPRDDDNRDDSGSAYVFKRSGGTWTQQAKLLADDGAEGDEFGTSVSISGDIVVVGSYGDDDNKKDFDYESGSAYVFKRSGDYWSQRVKLLADDGALGDYFGSSVSISCDCDTATIVVGSPYDDLSGDDSGSVYVTNEL